MARPGVTREQVFKAADALAEEGVQPTVKLVRDRIGGSFSTITPHLASWKDEHGGRSVASIPDMPESVVTACRQVWAAAWKAGQETIQTERDGLSAARREMEKEREEMAAEITELEGELEKAVHERENLARALAEEEKKNRAMQEELGAVRVENARLTERAENAQQRAEEYREQVARLESDLARIAEAKETPKKKPAPKTPPSDPPPP